MVPLKIVSNVFYAGAKFKPGFGGFKPRLKFFKFHLWSLKTSQTSEIANFYDEEYKIKLKLGPIVSDRRLPFEIWKSGMAAIHF